MKRDAQRVAPCASDVGRTCDRLLTLLGNTSSASRGFYVSPAQRRMMVEIYHQLAAYHALLQRQEQLRPEPQP